MNDGAHTEHETDSSEHETHTSEHTASVEDANLHEEGNPFADAELVVYSATAEWADEEPTHENLDELGLTSWSLWARFEEDKVEIPILAEASWHTWFSLSAESFQPDPAEPVSDDFVRVLAGVPDKYVGDGWGDVDRDTYEQLSDLEQYIVALVVDAFVTMENAEPALVIDWCENNHPDAGGDGGD